jgi:hypothetical protein
VVNAVQQQDPVRVRRTGCERRFPMSVLLAVALSQWCQKKMVAAGVGWSSTATRVAWLHVRKKLWHAYPRRGSRARSA